MRILEGRLPVGDREVRLTWVGEGALVWRRASATAALPAEEPSIARLHARTDELTVRHEGARPRGRTDRGHRSQPPPPRSALGDVLGGTPPTERLRALSYHARQLARPGDVGQ